MPTPLYRFVPTDKIEVATAKGKLYLFGTARRDEQCSLRASEFELANLFNGRRSEEEIRDVVHRTNGRELSADDLRAFVRKLQEAGLLAPVPPPARKQSSAAAPTDAPPPRRVNPQPPSKVATPTAPIDAAGQAAMQPHPAAVCSAASDPLEVAHLAIDAAAAQVVADNEEPLSGKAEVVQPDREPRSAVFSGDDGRPVLRPGAPRRRMFNRLATRARQIELARPRTPRIGSKTKLVLVVGALIGAGMIPYRYEPGGEFVLRPLQNSRTDVRSLISGRVDAVLVNEGDSVLTGQVLARVSGDEERKNVDSTEANIRELRAQLAKALAGATPEQIAVARQRVSTAATRYEFSRGKEERYAQLRESGFASPQDYENVRAAAENDRESLAQAEKELAQLLAGTRQEEIDALRAAIDQQQANLVYHRQQLQYTEIRAPITGRIVSGSLLTAAGNYLKNGDLFATIEDTSRLLAEIQVPQSDIGLVDIAAPIRLKAWMEPNLAIKGAVQTIGPSAEDTPAGKMVRVTSEVDNRSTVLRSGMTGYAKAEGKEMPTAVAFTRLAVRFFQIEFWSWLP